MAVEGRHQQLAGALVLAGVLEEQRVLAHDRAEDGVALAGVEHLGVAGEDLLRVLGPREQHERPAPRDHPHGEDVAVLPVRPRHEPVTEAQQPRALDQGRPLRAGREPARVDRRRDVTPEGQHPLEALLGQRGDSVVGGASCQCLTSGRRTILRVRRRAGQSVEGQRRRMSTTVCSGIGLSRWALQVSRSRRLAPGGVDVDDVDSTPPTTKTASVSTPSTCRASRRSAPSRVSPRCRRSAISAAWTGVGNPERPRKWSRSSWPDRWRRGHGDRSRGVEPPVVEAVRQHQQVAREPVAADVRDLPGLLGMGRARARSRPGGRARRSRRRDGRACRRRTATPRAASATSGGRPAGRRSRGRARRPGC